MEGQEKILFLLKEIYQNDYSKQHYLDIIRFSKFDFEEFTQTLFAKGFRLYKVTIHTEYKIYLRHYSYLDSLCKILKEDLTRISPLPVDKVNIVPDYSKIEIINSEIQPVYTEWEEINKSQFELLEQLKKTSTSFEIKNIGNTSRTILKKLATIVFKKEKHTPKDTTIDISGDKYKNQLHSYIKIELEGHTQTELRGFAESAINLVEKAIILTNAVTHRNSSEKQIAEVCVISTIAVISIINFIETASTKTSL